MNWVRRGECRVGRTERNMKKKITVVTLGAILFALCMSAEAQQAGKVARIGFKHCFRQRGARGGVPARAEQTWLD
jgi:hypothetical protein